ncbi:MAG: hypothetical protein Dasosvirus4_36 [Dasosvirus sp.]|uniref:Uncharacterized protein n=1 Tax=Dasosvirus sp. TaxID=2487764 RepID=A0A3G4ZRM1_9VIRU|nr:MAG: hypothetical protein Dasosvirus4_36 [Dasosvirus sp.]
MTTSGSTVETLTKHVVEDGVIYKSVTNVTKYWSYIDPSYKRMIYIYLIIVMLNYFTSTYQDAKKYLLAYRKGGASIIEYGFATEFDACYYGSREHWFDNFVSALVFPYKWVANVMPTIVVALNPPENQPYGISFIVVVTCLLALVASIAMYFIKLPRCQ